MSVESIAKLVDDVLANCKNANSLIKIIGLIDPKEEESVTTAASNGAVKIFSDFFGKKDVLFSCAAGHRSSPVQQYKLWVGDRYLDSFSAMLACLNEVSQNGQIVLLGNCMELLKFKSRHLTVLKSQHKEYVFPENELYDLIISVLLCDNNHVTESLADYLAFDDIRYFLLKCLTSLMDNEDIMKENGTRTVFFMLESAAQCMPTEEGLTKSFVFSEMDLETLELSKSSNCFSFSVRQQRKIFTKAWLQFLKRPLNGSLHKKILTILHTLVIPNFSKPRLLADFLMRSFDYGDGLALLALHGLFVLMHEHNLEYPNFYENLYGMLHPRIFEKKYRTRFFNLLQLFLSSTHIPSYLVAAFIKKMSRLALCAAPHTILLLLQLIFNLLRSHPTMSHLIDKHISICDITMDPFKNNEIDPANCCAMDSSLWELAALSHHYLPVVTKAAHNLMNFSSPQCDVDKMLYGSYKDLIDFDESKFTSTALNHITPSALTVDFEDLMGELWSI